MEIGIPALRIISISFIPAAVGFIMPTMFQAMGKGMDSLVVFLMRQLVITLPLAWLLSGFLGLTGIWISFIVAEAAGAVTAMGIYRKIRKQDAVLQ